MAKQQAATKKTAGQRSERAGTPRARARKKTGKKRAQTHRISVQKYKEMYQAYVAEQTVSNVAATCHVSRETAAHYIDDGDPERNLLPIAERFRRVQAEAARQEDMSLAKALKETSALVRASKAAWGRRIKEVLETKGGMAKLDPNQMVRELRRIHDLERELLTDIEVKEKPRAPILTQEEAHAAAMAIIHVRREKEQQQKKAEQEAAKPKTVKKRRLRPPPKRKTNLGT